MNFQFRAVDVQRVFNSILVHILTILSSQTGSGKSTNLVPKIALKWLRMDETRKIIFTSPRRITCEALYDRIKQQFPYLKISMLHGKSNQTDPAARFLVCTPAVAEKMCRNFFSEFSSSAERDIEYLFIMDEFHDCSAGYMKYFFDTIKTAFNGKCTSRLLIMSATLEEQAIRRCLERCPERILARDLLSQENLRPNMLDFTFGTPYKKRIYSSAEAAIAFSNGTSQFERRIRDHNFADDNMNHLRNRWTCLLDVARATGRSPETILSLGEREYIRNNIRNLFLQFYNGAVEEGMAPITEAELLSTFGVPMTLKSELMTEIARHFMELRVTGIILMVPGIKEIQAIWKALDGVNGYKVFKVHAQLHPVDWEKAEWNSAAKFVIVGTCVLEDSVTIPRVEVFIDSGVENQVEVDVTNQAEKMVCVPITRSAEKQRQGRIGRTNKGIYISLRTEECAPVRIPNEKEFKDVALGLLISQKEDSRYLRFMRGAPFHQQLEQAFSAFLVDPRERYEPGFFVNKIIKSLEMDNMIYDKQITTLGQWCEKIGCDMNQARMLFFGVIYDTTYQSMKMASLLKLEDLDEKNSLTALDSVREEFKTVARRICTHVSPSDGDLFLFPVESHLLDALDFYNMLMSLGEEERLFLQRVLMLSKEKYQEFEVEYAHLKQALYKLLKRINILDARQDKSGISFPARKDVDRSAAHKVLLATGLLGYYKDGLVHYCDADGNHRCALMMSSTRTPDESGFLVSHCVRYRPEDNAIIWKHLTFMKITELRYSNATMLENLLNWMEREEIIDANDLSEVRLQLQFAQRRFESYRTFCPPPNLRGIFPRNKFAAFTLASEETQRDGVSWFFELPTVYDPNLLQLSVYQPNMHSFACPNCNGLGHNRDDCQTPTDIVELRKKIKPTAKCIHCLVCGWYSQEEVDEELRSCNLWRDIAERFLASDIVREQLEEAGYDGLLEQMQKFYYYYERNRQLECSFRSL